MLVLGGVGVMKFIKHIVRFPNNLEYFANVVSASIKGLSIEIKRRVSKRKD